MNSVLFCVGQFLLNMGPSLECGYYSQSHLKKSNLSPGSHQLQMTFWLGWNLVFILPSSCWGFWLAWTCVVLCILSQYPWIHVCVSPVTSGKYSFLGIFYSLWFLLYFPFFLLWLARTLQERCGKEIILALSAPESLQNTCWSPNLVIFLFHQPSKLLKIYISNLVFIAFYVAFK